MPATLPRRAGSFKRAGRPSRTGARLDADQAFADPGSASFRCCAAFAVSGPWAPGDGQTVLGLSTSC